jgi:glycosyltransferase involved in cell wall biosynthesis
MKILMISSYLPYPLFSGGQVRLYNLIKELSGRHDITLICEKRSYQTDDDVAQVKKICKDVIYISRKKQWSFANIIKAGFSPRSFLVTGHTNAEFEQKICETLKKNKFDLIHVETYYVIRNLLDVRRKIYNVRSVPVVLCEHNIEYKVYEKYKDRAPLFLRPLLKIDINKIRKEEEFYWKKADALVAVSREDQAVMKKAGCDSSLVSNGVNTEQFAFTNYEKRSAAFKNEKRILYLGDFTWIQNRDAVTFIIKEIFPEIQKELRTRNHELRVRLWIVGRKIPEAIRSLTNDPDIMFDEESSGLPTENIFQNASVLLAPIRIGGGTSYKILEAMSCGTPVVTMQMSADAISAADGQDIMVGNNSKQLAEKSLVLLTNDILYKTIAKNGRALVEKNYTWKEIGKKLEGVYQRVI